MTPLRFSLVVFALVTAIGCSEEIQTVVRFGTSPDLDLPGDAELWLTFWDSRVRQHQTGQRLGPFEYREDIKVTVDAGDSEEERRFTLFAELLTPAGERLSWARVRTGFGSRSLSEVRVTFANGCPAPADQELQNADYHPRRACGSHDTCIPDGSDAQCAPACVTPEPFVTMRSETPTPVEPCADADCAFVEEVYSSGAMTCAITREREGFCWGRISFAQTGEYPRYPARVLGSDGVARLNPEDEVVEFAGFVHQLCALYSDGRVRCGGANAADTGLEGYALGVTEDLGTRDPAPCCTVEPAFAEEDVSDIGGGAGYMCGVTQADGRIVCVGLHPQVRIDGSDPMPGATDLLEAGQQQMVAGRFSVCGRTDGPFSCLGGPLDFGSEFDPGPIQSIDVAERSLCVVSEGGEALCWGARIDENYRADRAHEEQPRSLGGGWQRISLARALFSETNHRCGIRADGSLSCWGSNEFGQVGARTTGPGAGFSEQTPHRVAGSWADVALGRWHTCGARSDGRLLCWGHNDFQELGVDGPDRSEPTEVCVPSW